MMYIHREIIAPDVALPYGSNVKSGNGEKQDQQPKRSPCGR